MSKGICIVLNEREPLKAEAAETLQNALTEKGLPAYRLPVTKSLAADIKDASPSILVIDYLLGDYTTGLDVLEFLGKENSLPKTFFYTDEPSQSVAVLSFRAGSSNYFLLNNPEEFSRLLEELVAEWIKLSERQPRTKKKAQSRLVWNSEVGLAHQRELELLASQPPSMTVFVGPAGAGKRTAAGLVCKLSGLSAPVEITPENFSLPCVRGITRESLDNILRASSTPLLIPNVRNYDGEILTALSEFTENFERRILVTTTDESLSDYFSSGSVNTCVVPSLEDRGREDIRGFALECIREYSKLAKIPEVKLDASLLNLLCEREYSYNFSQLSEVLMNAIFRYKHNNSDIAEEIEFTYKVSCSKKKASLDAEVSDFQLLQYFSFYRQDLRLTAVQLGLSPEETFKRLLDLTGKAVTTRESAGSAQ